MSIISNNCDRAVVLAETFFLGLITIYTGWVISGSTFTNSIPSIVLIGTGFTFMLCGLIFATSMRIRNRVEYHQIEPINSLV